MKLLIVNHTNTYQSDLTKLKNQLAMRATIQDLEQIKERFDDYVSKDYIDELVYGYKPLVEKLHDQVKMFDVKVSQFSEIIRRFDEVISEKASKV